MLHLELTMLQSKCIPCPVRTGYLGCIKAINAACITINAACRIMFFTFSTKSLSKL